MLQHWQKQWANNYIIQLNCQVKSAQSDNSQGSRTLDA